MAKKCYQCGSENTARVVPAAIANLPDIRKELIEGTAVVSCCNAGGFANAGRHRCKDCGFEWDYYYEISMQNQ